MYQLAQKIISLDGSDEHTNEFSSCAQFLEHLKPPRTTLRRKKDGETNEEDEDYKILKTHRTKNETLYLNFKKGHNLSKKKFFQETSFFLFG